MTNTMHAVLLQGHGGFDQLEHRTDVAVPEPRSGEVLVRVGAAGVNNTDINTRLGWYSKAVTAGTGSSGDGFDEPVDDDGGWSGSGLSFPRIQGADVAGTIVGVGSDISESRIGERVLVRPMQQDHNSSDPMSCVTLGSEFDGGFAQFCVTDSREAFAINSNLTDVELASFPCAYSTAEGLLDRAGVAEGERVLITGASGGVGSAAVQLSKRRGASVVAIASRIKWTAVESLGADELIDRGADLIDELGHESIDVVIDVVAGPTWPSMLDVLKRGGRYATSGAIAGPIVELDVRTLYLKDLSLLGSTRQPRVVFESLVGYIERGEIDPVIASTFPLSEIVAAQQAFLGKSFTGKLVLIPSTADADAAGRDS